MAQKTAANKEPSLADSLEQTITRSAPFSVKFAQMPKAVQEELQEIKRRVQDGRISVGKRTIYKKCKQAMNINVSRDAFEQWLKQS